VITCPAPRRDGYVYQRVIDNRVGDRVLDIRVPIIGDSIPFVYFKYRPVATRFSNTNERAELRATADALSAEEREQLLALSRSMGVDYGELDVLRDADDGLLYVVDVNTTPSGPPNGLGRRDRIRAIIELSRAFETEFLTPTPR
jgi:glutathione synthase/RimK-type ligase-like ATP-grasp enzyme